MSIPRSNADKQHSCWKLFRAVNNCAESTNYFLFCFFTLTIGKHVTKISSSAENLFAEVRNANAVPVLLAEAEPAALALPDGDLPPPPPSPAQLGLPPLPPPPPPAVPYVLPKPEPVPTNQAPPFNPILTIVPKQYCVFRHSFQLAFQSISTPKSVPLQKHQLWNGWWIYVQFYPEELNFDLD